MAVVADIYICIVLFWKFHIMKTGIKRYVPFRITVPSTELTCHRSVIVPMDYYALSALMPSTEASSPREHHRSEYLGVFSRDSITMTNAEASKWHFLCWFVSCDSVV